MPCIDRKTESIRKEFYNQESEVTDVDLVLTTEETLEMLQMKNIDLMSMPTLSVHDIFSKPGYIGEQIFGSFGSPSDGYLEYVLMETAKQLWDLDIHPAKIEYLPESIRDFKLVHVKVNGEVVLRFGRAYGFRHIQGVLRNIKQNKSQIDFIEVMACPGGCTNGGAQIQPSDPLEGDQLLAKVNEQYFSQSPDLESQKNQAKKLMAEWIGTDSNSQQLHTSYQKTETTKSKGCKCSAQIQW